MKRIHKYCIESDRCPRVFTSRVYILILLIVFITPLPAYCGGDPSYDEVSVTLNVQRIGSVEMPAVINAGEAYLPIKELFDFLKIRNTPSSDLDSIHGFFIDPKAKFLVDKNHNRILYQDKTYDVKPADFIFTGTGLYLKSDYFGKVFGLECIFNFRDLSITLNTKLELPAIRQMQQELLRKNVSQLKGEKKADTTIKRGFSFFNLGTADWNITTTQQTKMNSSTRLNVGLGAVIAGGEANVNLAYNSGEPFNLNQQYYRWRYVNNDHSGLRQITAGRIFTQSISSIYAPVTGVQLTNTPTTYRKSFGTYRLTNTTEPGWMVELYVNNVLVNYMKADASGFFTFDVPIVYGNSVIKLRFYGPWGEERTREQNITIPFNFLPEHQFEYNFSAGLVQDDEKSKFTRANFNYGLNKRITIGGGVEYLSSASLGKPMPFVNASVRLGNNLLISAEHDNGIRSRGTFNYRLPSDLQLDLDYIKYQPGQTAIKLSYLEERKASLSIPIRSKKLSAFSRLTYNEYIMPKGKYNSAEFLLSTIIRGVSSNLTTSAVYYNPAYPTIYSNLSLAFRLPARIRLTSQAQYEYSQKNFSLVKFELEKPLFTKGFMNLSYERNMISKIGFSGIGFRYNFSFVQASFSGRHGNKSTSTTQSVRGSLMYDGKSQYLRLNNQSTVGKGGLVIVSFLDLNANGHRDANEPKAYGLKLKINGGNIEHDEEDTTIRVIGLAAYTNYFIELDKNSFENISWQIRKATIAVTIEPNHFKTIEVPVSVVGEASGTVFFKGNKGKKGLGRIIINFYNSNAVLVGKTLTEDDGYFSFLGLAAGSYTACIDTAQLHTLNMVSSPDKLSFDIASSTEGVIADGFEFIVQSSSKSEADNEEGEEKKTKSQDAAVAQKKLPFIAEHPLVQQKNGKLVINYDEKRAAKQLAQNKQATTSNRQLVTLKKQSIISNKQPVTFDTIAPTAPVLSKKLMTVIKYPKKVEPTNLIQKQGSANYHTARFKVQFLQKKSKPTNKSNVKLANKYIVQHHPSFTISSGSNEVSGDKKSAALFKARSKAGSVKKLQGAIQEKTEPLLEENKNILFRKIRSFFGRSQLLFFYGRR
jgi:hypothetical protein